MTTGFGPSSCGIGVTSAHSALSEIGSCLELVDTSSSDDSLILGLGSGNWLNGFEEKIKPDEISKRDEIDFLYFYFCTVTNYFFAKLPNVFEDAQTPTKN